MCVCICVPYPRRKNTSTLDIVKCKIFVDMFLHSHSVRQQFLFKLSFTVIYFLHVAVVCLS